MKRFEHGGNVCGKNIRLDFSVNTNPLGLNTKIKEAALSAADKYGVYPDAEYADLKSAIASYEGVSASNVAVSNGASEMIFAAVRAVMPKKALLIAPTFSEYERALLSVGCEIDYYALKEENDFETGADILNVLDNYDMTFICNPNNPTGRLCNGDIMDKMAQSKCVCIADECFLDFTDGTSVKGKMPVIRAFTKTHAMAGLRLGYMIADEDFTEKINANFPAWNVSAPAAAAGIAATEQHEYVAKAKQLIKTEREYLRTELTRLGFKVFPSDANFLLIKGKERIAEKLLSRGIFIRECDNFRGLDTHYYRIAVKTHEENEMLINELTTIR
ncbi:MAG: aminotransferase class I/II-fold pyridoxal phosphate-dependent enzyme [Clostridia bacterium]|nr:aminotransferase class I/II-fold pyridoxal phosphate-dependent enzyme [Clostridia bacterium]